MSNPANPCPPCVLTRHETHSLFLLPKQRHTSRVHALPRQAREGACQAASRAFTQGEFRQRKPS